MKNFETKCPIEGTSALKPKVVFAPAQRANIVAIPGRAAPAQASFVTALRAGSIQGAPFDRMRRWQAVVGGCAFAAAALSCLLVSL